MLYPLQGFRAISPACCSGHSHPIGISVKAQKKVVGMVL
jgi:hypothetical protein